jgi:hypothetical protein
VTAKGLGPTASILGSKMADVADVIAERAHPFLPHIDIKSAVTCINCAQMKRQLDYALLQLKSLQKITELLQQDSEVPKTVNLGGIADKCVIANHKEVENAHPNSSSSITSKLFESDLNNVSNNDEALNLLNDTRHRGNSSISSVNVEPSSSMSTSNSKIISQVNSSVKWSDVAAGRVKHCHQSTSASLYNIPTVINGQVLPTGKSVPKYKKGKLAMKSSAIISIKIIKSYC